MWPWEHLALGYIGYSCYRRLSIGTVPGATDVLVLAFGTQFPDLVDKPLAWTFNVLPNGLSLAHSLFSLIAVCLAVVAISRYADRPTLGYAFSAGYSLHLLGDMLYPLITDGEFAYAFLFWPLVERPPVETTTFLTELVSLLVVFRAFLASPVGRLYLLFETALIGGAVLLWARDGQPGRELLTRFAADTDDDRGRQW